MANPELQRDAPEHDWVEYLQQKLVENLQADGGVQLSAVDGVFGPITEGSVRYLQAHNSLPETGVVDEATWQLLEAPPGTGGGGGAGTGTGTGTKIDLTVPFTLKTRWQDATFEQIQQDLGQFDLTSHPTAKLKYHSPIGKTFGQGGLQLINQEIRGWNWWLEWSTKGTLDFTKKNGIDLGVDNHAELGVRPLRGVELTVEGNLKMTWDPINTKGDIQSGGMLWLKLNIDQLLGP